MLSLHCENSHSVAAKARLDVRFHCSEALRRHAPMIQVKTRTQESVLSPVNNPGGCRLRLCHGSNQAGVSQRVLNQALMSGMTLMQQEAPAEADCKLLLRWSLQPSQTRHPVPCSPRRGVGFSWMKPAWHRASLGFGIFNTVQRSTK